MTVERLTLCPDQPDGAVIDAAARVIRSGGVVAYPTEHFYALGVDPTRPDAVGRLFELKGRGPDKPALLAIAQRQSLVQWVKSVPLHAAGLVSAWPEGLTMLFPAAEWVPPGVQSAAGSVGVRLVQTPSARMLINACGDGLTATSANRSGDPASGDPDRVAESLPGLDLLLDAGVLPGGALSTLLDVTESPWRIRREGAVSADTLATYGHVAASEPR